VGTPLAEGREWRTIDGETHLYYDALPCDLALVRAWRADDAGNLQFRGTGQNYNTTFARAAKRSLAEVDDVVETGCIPPSEVDVPGVFIAGVTQRAATAATTGDERPPRGSGQPRFYFGHPALTPDQMAERVAKMLPDNAIVNLGVGLPSLVAKYLGERGIKLHAGNGVIGYRAPVPSESFDAGFIDAASQTVVPLPGAATFDSATNYEMLHSGRVQTAVLGAFQVDATGSFANWRQPGAYGGAIGGAMDLAVAVPQLIVAMQHCEGENNRPRLVESCDLPLTGQGCVTTVVTDLGVFERTVTTFAIKEIAPGFTVKQVESLTGLRLAVPEHVGTMT
jgi:3-oxoacid CoA-transferase